MMFLSRMFGRKSGRKATARKLFASVSAQSRLPILYGEGLIADSFDGRFEAITLHSALLMRRLHQIELVGKKRFDDFSKILFSSFDHAYREDGVGDLIVGKKMRRLGESFVGRVMAYERALESGEGLEEALARNLFEGRQSDKAAQMATYVLQADECLAKMSDEAVLNAELNWPTPVLD